MFIFSGKKMFELDANVTYKKYAQITQYINSIHKTHVEIKIANQKFDGDKGYDLTEYDKPITTFNLEHKDLDYKTLKTIYNHTIINPENE